jgi:hypothetical protein
MTSKKATVTLTVTSEKYLERAELGPLLEDLKAAQDNEDAIESLEELIKPDPTDLEFEVYPDDLLEAAGQDMTEDDWIDHVFGIVNEEDIHAELVHREYKPAKPIKAEDYNNYDFKRLMCDVFSQGYHVSNTDLLRMIAERIDPNGWAMIF